MFRRLFPSGLRPRLMVLIAFMVGACTALMVFQAVQQRNEAVRAAESEAVLLSRLAAAYEERSVAVARHLLGDIAQHDRVRAAHARAIQPLLEELRAGEHVSLLAVADSTGHILASTRREERGADVSTSRWFRGAASSGGFLIARAPGRGESGGEVLRGAIPVRDASGRLLAVASAELESGWLQEVANHAHVPGRTSVVLVDAHGGVLTRYPPGPAGAPDSNIVIPPDARAEWLQAVHGGDGHAHIVAFSPLASRTPGAFYVGVSVDQTAAAADATRAFARSLLLLLFAGLCVALVAWFGVEIAVLRRVNALVSATRRLREGDLSARTDLPYGHGELSHLARAFDDMAAEIQHENEHRRKRERALQISEAHKSAVLESSLDGILVLDSSGRVLDCNAAARKLFGCEARRGEHHSAAQLFRGIDLTTPAHPLAPGKRVEGIGRRMDGSTFPVEVGLAPIRDRGDWGRYVATVRDLTERKRWERSVQALTFVDDLTGLYNRRGFTMFATQQIRLAARTGQQVVLVSVDLDGLKAINDTFGHGEGDRAILEMAVLLRRSFRESDVIARFGGDEFVALATENEMIGAESILERLAERIALRNERGDLPWTLSASFGWTRIDAASAPPLADLLSIADGRMYEAKRAARGSAVRTPEPLPGAEADEDAGLEPRLRRPA